jgi:glutathione S-transferase
LTLADVFLVPQVYNAERFGVDMTQFPRISAVNANLSALPDFQKCHPSQQPDADQ